ncbi:hypothetical protein K4R79_04155 [Staphylococcus epidermidis]|uniref:hypothetical protein n=1 Tax=Staphylococcus epidermidis TaxID=1282 RepID=UPI00026C0571|nr:hypothetical protein [Staphylococcus epidermidis]EJE15595.1 hypothetical protein HMPREF9980_06421 [Staphylococcus epidermidis NIHLM031]MBM0791792.1 hypothetical protein [Staphylococcus epidermidis]MCG1165093.1 hypothetical protein [Staphylococcus epidermidis]MCG1807426.1 hypothetical protein [Staphylococcus epidermidis]MCG2009961.1 hypothetical protein [Staphylococcus epidermidis]
MLRKYWIHFVIVTVIVSLLSIKGFPLALGALYLPLLFKIVQLQLNLSKGLIDNVNAHTFIKSNQSGVMISVVCCLLITGVLTYTLDDFYNELPGVLGILVSISPITLTIGVILFVLTAIAIVQATKAKYQQPKN